MITKILICILIVNSFSLMYGNSIYIDIWDTKSILNKINLLTEGFNQIQCSFILYRIISIDFLLFGNLYL
jgi:hypothetical protein